MAKKNKCCGLPWADSKCECTLNDILLKLLPAGHPVGNYEIVSDGDGNYNIISSSSSTLTPATMVDNGDLTLTFNNGVNPPVTFDAKKTVVLDNGDGTFILTDDFGTIVTIDTNDVITTLVDDPNKTFVYTNESGVPVTVDYKIAVITDNGDKTFNYTDDFGATGVIDTNDVVTTLIDNGNKTYEYTSEDGTITIIDANDVLTTYVDDVVAGNKIGTYTDETGTPIDVTETITLMSQQPNGDIEYLSEDGGVDAAVILSTDANQLLKSGSDNGNLLTATDLISIDANNTITAGSDGKLFAPIVSVFPDDQVFNGINTNTANVTLTALPPTPEGQVDYNLEINVKTQCEINSDASGIKLADSFYENIGTSHITTLPTLTAFDPTKEVKQVNVVKDGCSLKAFVNKEEDLFVKFHGVSDIDLNVLTDISVGGVSPDVISIIVTSLAADFDFSNWYINTLTTGKKVGQKFIVALDIDTPLFSMTYDHANAGLIKSIFDDEILTVKALEVNTLYED